jgi:molybdenum cofactor biosynthesis enzyme MoaA
MLRFPLRLTTDLTRARITQKLRGTSAPEPILLIRPMDQVNSSALGIGELSPDKRMGTELLARVRSSAAPVVWIGGPEPLLYPEMGQLARCIAGHGQHVFLETDGILLRRRIHEFRPVPLLFLAVQLNGLAPSHNLRACRTDAFQLAVEGIGAAKLSGFLICAHARIDAETNLGEIAELMRFAKTLDLDGFIVSRAAGSPNNTDRTEETLESKTVAARKLIRNRWWAHFSRVVETVLNRNTCTEQRATSAARSIEQEPNATEESVRIA